MQKIQRQKVSSHVTPGIPFVHVVSALRGGNAERILRQVHALGATAGGYESAQLKLSFPEWPEGADCVVGHCKRLSGAQECELVLHVGAQRGLFLEDSYGLFSLKSKGGELLSPSIPTGSPRTGQPFDSWCANAAKAILGTWVLHGSDWMNRYGDVLEFPFGPNGHPRELIFKAEDKGVIFPDCNPRVVGRCTHAGSWKGSNAASLAEAGYTVLLHEFNEASGSGRDICTCGEARISEDSTLWPPVARWSNRNLKSVKRMEELQAIANSASSPFAFHTAASQLLFPNVTLLSPFLLQRIGEEKLRAVLETIQRESSERFYRLIDRTGSTKRWTRSEKTRIFFDDGSSLARETLAENALASFKEMRELQHDPAFLLPPRERIVLDSHFYVVMIAVATHQDGVAVHLSGRHTYQYMFRTAEAQMHRVRNDRLLRLVAPVLGIPQLRFEVYLPPIGVAERDQYSM